MKDLKKIFILFFFLIVAAFCASAVWSFLKSPVDLGIEKIEPKVFDLQVKLRSLSAGTLLEDIRGWDPEKQEKEAEKVLPAISYVFGMEYLKALLSSSSSVSGSPEFKNIESARFPDISPVGVSLSGNFAVLTLNFAGNVQIWLFKKEGGEWKTKDIPFGYFLEDVNISKEYVSFVLCAGTSEKRKYEFSFATVPEQYASP